MSDNVFSQNSGYLIQIIGTHNMMMTEWLKKIIEHSFSIILKSKNSLINVRCIVSDKISSYDLYENEHVILINNNQIVDHPSINPSGGTVDLCKIIRIVIDNISNYDLYDLNCYDDFKFISKSQMDLVEIFFKIDLFVKGKQIFTIDSILTNLIDLFYIDNNVETMIRFLGIDALRTAIIMYLDISGNVSLVNKLDLIKINYLLKKENISIRNIFCIQKIIYTNMSNPFITKEKLYEIFNKNNIPTKLYDSLDPIKMIDMVNEIFRPLESLTEELEPNTKLNMRSGEYPMVVIIPSYNNRTKFKETLNSVFNQNYQNYRIIFIDDCSDVIGDVLEIDEIRAYVNTNKQNSRFTLISQHVRQRQCAGRYIGYHMSYDDEIVILLDGDDRLYDNNAMRIISYNYREKHIASSYGGYVDMCDKIIHTKIKGIDQFPEHVIVNRSYRSYMYISVHLRTGFAKLFKSIRLINLLDNNDNFFHVATDTAEMMPIHEMLTYDRTRKRGMYEQERLKYFDVIKEPLCIYNRDNSIIYTTSFARRNEEKNDYKQYRIDALKKIRSEQKYPFVLKLSEPIQTNTDYFTDIMINYGLDMLIINISNAINNNYNDLQDSIKSDVIKNFNTGKCLYLNGKIMNGGSDNIIIKALVGRNISDEEIDIIKSHYRCIIRKRSDCQIDIPIIGYLEALQ